MLRRAIARLVLRLSGWRAVGHVPRAGILVGAPHTSNWDWVAMLLLTWRDGVQARVLIKRELFTGPLLQSRLLAEGCICVGVRQRVAALLQPVAMKVRLRAEGHIVFERDPERRPGGAVREARPQAGASRRTQPLSAAGAC